MLPSKFAVICTKLKKCFRIDQPVSYNVDQVQKWKTFILSKPKKSQLIFIEKSAIFTDRLSSIIFQTILDNLLPSSSEKTKVHSSHSLKRYYLLIAKEKKFHLRGDGYHKNRNRHLGKLLGKPPEIQYILLSAPRQVKRSLAGWIGDPKDGKPIKEMPGLKKLDIEAKRTDGNKGSKPERQRKKIQPTADDDEFFSVPENTENLENAKANEDESFLEHRSSGKSYPYLQEKKAFDMNSKRSKCPSPAVKPKSEDGHYFRPTESERASRRFSFTKEDDEIERGEQRFGTKYEKRSLKSSQKDDELEEEGKKQSQGRGGGGGRVSCKRLVERKKKASPTSSAPQSSTESETACSSSAPPSCPPKELKEVPDTAAPPECPPPFPPPCPKASSPCPRPRKSCPCPPPEPPEDIPNKCPTTPPKPETACPPPPPPPCPPPKPSCPPPKSSCPPPKPACPPPKPPCPPPKPVCPPPMSDCPPPDCAPNFPPFPPPCPSSQSNAPQMEALQFDPVCKTLNFYMLKAPTEIHKDEVLVQVVYSGVCGSDISLMEGKLPSGKDPIILGHEFSGIACAVGSGVKHVQCGDCIAVDPYAPCHVCRYCTNGEYGACPYEGLNNAIGTQKDGGWAEFVVVPKYQVHKIPSTVTLDQAALLQPLSCVLHAMSKIKLSYGHDILIQGIGLAGSLWASVLHMKGFKNVAVCDKSEDKRKQFEWLKTDYCTLTPEMAEEVNPDVVIDCTGSVNSLLRAVQILNPHGQLCIFGIPKPGEALNISAYDISKKELKIFGVISNQYNFSNAIILADLMGCRYLDYKKLGIQTFRLGQYEGAFKMRACGKVGKIMFKIESVS